MPLRMAMNWLWRQNWRTTDQHTYYILARTGEILNAAPETRLPAIGQIVTRDGDRIVTHDNEALLIAPGRKFVRR